MPKGRRRKKRASKKTQGWPRTVARFVLRLGIIFIGLSVLWVGFYRFAPVSGTTLMGISTLKGGAVETSWMPLDRISPQLVRAVIAAEDSKFCSHNGFDFEQIKIAYEDAMKGSGWRGASTISQQTSKNAFLWPGRGLIRKGMEAWFTVLQETMWPKSRTMEVYLNVAEWGPGVFGAQAAAQYWFHKDAEDLTAYEASLLAAILPSPKKWSANPPGPYVASRARALRKRMSVVRMDRLDGCIQK